MSPGSVGAAGGLERFGPNNPAEAIKIEMYLAKTGDPVALSVATFQDQFLKLDINNEFLAGFHDDCET